MDRTLIQVRQEGRRSRIFNLIRKNNEQLSRFDICKLTHYSTTTVTALVDALVEEGLVREDESRENRIGRRPSLLCLNSDGVYFIGVECSASGVNLTAINAMQEIVVKEDYPLQEPDTETILSAMRALLDGFAEKHAVLWEKVPSITFSVAGKIDTETGLAVQYRTVPDWDNVDLRARFSYLQKEILFLNNVDAMLTGYCTRYNLPPQKSVAFLIIRNSAGMRLFSGGRLLSRLGVACEVGHMKAEGSMRRCACGKKGCYDAEISITAVLSKLREAYYAGLLDAGQVASGDEITIETFLRLLEAGDPAVRDIFSEVVDYISQMLETVFAFFRPEVLILSSFLSEQKELLERALGERLRAQQEPEGLPELVCIPPASELAGFGAAIVGYASSFPAQSPEF